MSQPRIVLFDLETLPNLGEALKCWPALSQYPGTTLRASVSTIACAGYKVFGDDSVQCINAWDYPEWEVDVNDDRLVCSALYQVLESADCVVTHNGKRFDWKFMQSRLRYHKFPPLPKIHHVDTCSESKQELFLVNNRLQTVSDFFKSSGKMDHEGWPLWVKAHGGIPRSRDVDAEARMALYCKQDVLALEQVFKELRPLLKGLPNYNLFSPLKEKSCPKCGSTRLKSNGKRYTTTVSYRRYICLDCKAWCRTNLADDVPRGI